MVCGEEDGRRSDLFDSQLQLQDLLNTHLLLFFPAQNVAQPFTQPVEQVLNLDSTSILNFINRKQDYCQLPKW